MQRCSKTLQTGQNCPDPKLIIVWGSVYALTCYGKTTYDQVIVNFKNYFRIGTSSALCKDDEPNGSSIMRLARGVSDGCKSDGYLALIARFATVDCGTSETPVFLRWCSLVALPVLGSTTQSDVGVENR
jgi:hypothetical protein